MEYEGTFDEHQPPFVYFYPHRLLQKVRPTKLVDVLAIVHAWKNWTTRIELPPSVWTTTTTMDIQIGQKSSR